MKLPEPAALLRRFAATLVVGVGLSAVPAHAQFSMVPAPLLAAPVPSTATTDDEYKRDAAKHLYAAYPMRVFKGKMPPLLYGVAIIETEVDAEGAILDIRVRRPPGAPEVGPWIQQMIRKAAPFPPPANMGKAMYMDIWLVHKGGNFQLDTLTEGQH
jgi:periplasmic protein TonB